MNNMKVEKLNMVGAVNVLRILADLIGILVISIIRGYRFEGTALRA